MAFGIAFENAWLHHPVRSDCCVAMVVVIAVVIIVVARINEPAILYRIVTTASTTDRWSSGRKARELMVYFLYHNGFRVGSSKVIREPVEARD